jgi:hypothetical protein
MTHADGRRTTVDDDIRHATTIDTNKHGQATTQYSSMFSFDSGTHKLLTKYSIPLDLTSVDVLYEGFHSFC